ncbi:MAG: antitoxin PrlF [Candidatus Deianiraeaceae bacterium]|jgi:antitoxin PrlF
MITQERSYSKVTVKYQASIPAPIRKRLHIKAGDVIEFEEKSNGEVMLKKAQVPNKSTLKLMEIGLNEWSSKADDEQFAYLEKLVK